MNNQSIGLRCLVDSTVEILTYERAREQTKNELEALSKRRWKRRKELEAFLKQTEGKTGAIYHAFRG